MASPPLMPSVVIPAHDQIVQTEVYVPIFAEWMHDARIIRMNSTHVSPAIRKWLGDSIGYWEQETRSSSIPRTSGPIRHNLESGERLHVVERLTRIDATTLRYRVTVDPSRTWATAWTAEWPFKRDRRQAVPASTVTRGTMQSRNSLRGARAEERRARGPLR